MTTSSDEKEAHVSEIPKPSVGRIVHYVSYGTPGGEYTSHCRAAVVTEVDLTVENPQTVGLCVLNPTGQFFNRTVPYDDGEPEVPIAIGAYERVPEPLCDERWYRGGTWHWPERV